MKEMNEGEEEFLKECFKSLQGSDADYLLICQNNNDNFFWNIIPNELLIQIGANCEELDTIDIAIEHHLNYGYKNIKIYDLYAPFEESLIKIVY